MIDKITTYRKELFIEYHGRLTFIQHTYREIERQLSYELAVAIPKTEADVMDLDDMESQIKVADFNIKQIEEVKMHFALLLLTEGSLSSLVETTTIIGVLERLVQVAVDETKVGNEQVEKWADEKIVIYETILQLLYQILDHKKDRKLKTGAMTLQ